MEKKASPVLLLLPISLFLVIIVFVTLTITTLLSRPASVVANTVNTNTTNSTQNNTGNNNTAAPTNTSGNSAETDAFNKAVNAVPKSGFPNNTCPTHLILESGGNKFAIKGEDKFSINTTQLTWIQANCSEVKTINY